MSLKKDEILEMITKDIVLHEKRKQLVAKEDANLYLKEEEIRTKADIADFFEMV